MPKEPLTQTKKTGVTHGGIWGSKKYESELSERGKTKLQAQINKAESIMRVEKNANRSTSSTFYDAKRMRDRARKLLGGGRPTKPPSPGRKYPTPKGGGAKFAKRREPVEKATGTKHIKDALIGVAKRANKE